MNAALDNLVATPLTGAFVSDHDCAMKGVTSQHIFAGLCAWFEINKHG